MAAIVSRNDWSGLAALLEGEQAVYLVSDDNLSQYAEQVKACIPSLRGHYTITADEDHKTMETVMGICRFLMDLDADRKALVVTLGGGVTSDMAGFAACIYKRGVRYANIPTTLLSQVDAGIGGKTGVNLDSYKNELGVIRQPEWVYINPQVLLTLDDKQFRSGAAELLKTFILGGGEYYKAAVRAIASRDMDALAELIGAAASIKQRVVEEDPYEKGLRRILNLGHTFAHAIEWAQHSLDGYRGEALSHGEAVAVGMVLSAQVAEAGSMCPEGLAEELKSDFASCALPLTSPVPLDLLRSALLKDKKAEDGEIFFVLPLSIGRVEVRKMTISRIYDLLGNTE